MRLTAIRRRIAPAIPIAPVPSRSKDDGSGTGLLEKVPGEPGVPVRKSLPLVPNSKLTPDTMSANELVAVTPLSVITKVPVPSICGFLPVMDEFAFAYAVPRGPDPMIRSIGLCVPAHPKVGSLTVSRQTVEEFDFAGPTVRELPQWSIVSVVSIVATPVLLSILINVPAELVRAPPVKLIPLRLMRRPVTSWPSAKLVP